MVSLLPLRVILERAKILLGHKTASIVKRITAVVPMAVALTAGARKDNKSMAYYLTHTKLMEQFETNTRLTQTLCAQGQSSRYDFGDKSLYSASPHHKGFRRIGCGSWAQDPKCNILLRPNTSLPIKHSGYSDEDMLQFVAALKRLHPGFREMLTKNPFDPVTHTWTLKDGDPHVRYILFLLIRGIYYSRRVLLLTIFLAERGHKLGDVSLFLGKFPAPYNWHVTIYSTSVPIYDLINAPETLPFETAYGMAQRMYKRLDRPVKVPKITMEDLRFTNKRKAFIEAVKNLD